MGHIGVVIPVYRPDRKLTLLLEQMFRQTILPKEICLMLTLQNPEKKDDEVKALRRLAEEVRSRALVRLETENEENSAMWDPNSAMWDPNSVEVRILPLTKEHFNHGQTRQDGVEACNADFVLCMTQDAVPRNTKLIEELLGALNRYPKASQAYARQRVDCNADAITRLTQEFNYPETELVKNRESYGTLGIKTIFCSDVCCMYKKKVFLELGGFERRVIFNEDMMFARKAVDAGYDVIYAANAEVVHWHNYNMMQQFHRNFDNGVSQAEHPEVFADLPSEGEGAKMVKRNLGKLLKKGKIFSAVRYVFQSGAKLIGFKLGKNYKKLPRKLLLWCTMTPGYFPEK